MGARHVIIKGGHQPEDNHITDLLFDGDVYANHPSLYQYEAYAWHRPHLCRGFNGPNG